MANTKSMKILFDEFMNLGMCEEMHCKIPNKNKMDKTRYDQVLSRCLSEKCEKQIQKLVKALTQHIIELKKLILNYQNQNRKNVDKNSLINELNLYEKEIKAMKPSQFSMSRTQKIMNDMNKYYKVLG